MNLPPWEPSLRKPEMSTGKTFLSEIKIRKELKINKALWFCVLLFFVFFNSCEEDEGIPVPKPRGYPFLQLPEKSYRLWDTSSCPYAFEIPSYAQVRKKDTTYCWWNIVFPKNRATLHVSYKDVRRHKIENLIEDCHTLAAKHQIKAMGIDEVPIVIDSNKVYGLLYSIMGNTASHFQFYITDSTRHFLRGSLYFEAFPNYDSIQPVLEFLKTDMIHLIQTTRWK